MQPLASWVDAAVVLGRAGDECAFLHLYQPANAKSHHFCLDVCGLVWACWDVRVYEAIRMAKLSRRSWFFGRAEGECSFLRLY
jgi:hypothetical protein